MLTRNQETIFHAERDAKRELQIQIEQTIGKPKSLDSTVIFEPVS